jgi:hypothetical protein
MEVLPELVETLLDSDGENYKQLGPDKKNYEQKGEVRTPYSLTIAIVTQAIVQTALAGETEVAEECFEILSYSIVTLGLSRTMDNMGGNSFGLNFVLRDASCAAQGAQLSRLVVYTILQALQEEANSGERAHNLGKIKPLNNLLIGVITDGQENYEPTFKLEAVELLVSINPSPSTVRSFVSWLAPEIPRIRELLEEVALNPRDTLDNRLKALELWVKTNLPDLEEQSDDDALRFKDTIVDLLLLFCYLIDKEDNSIDNLVLPQSYLDSEAAGKLANYLKQKFLSGKNVPEALAERLGYHDIRHIHSPHTNITYVHQDPLLMARRLVVLNFLRVCFWQGNGIINKDKLENIVGLNSDLAHP